MSWLSKGGAAFLVAALVAPASVAVAAGQPVPSSISEYIEQVPTTTGSSAVGGGSTQPPTALSPTAQQALAKNGGGDTATLHRISVSPADGAPAAPVASTAKPVQPKPAGSTAPSKQPVQAVAASGAESTPGALSAAGSTLGGGGLWILGLVLLMITAGGLALARRPT